MVALVEVGYHIGSHADTFWYVDTGAGLVGLGRWADAHKIRSRCVRTCRGTHPVYRYLIPDDKLPLKLVGVRHTSRGNTRRKVFNIEKPGIYRLNYLLEKEEWRESEVVEIWLEEER